MAARRLIRVLVFLAALGTGPAWGETVPVRAADHGDWGRVVFDWGAPVGHSVAVRGRELVITFDRPMEGSFDQVARWLKGYVSDTRLEDGGRKAVFTLTGDFAATDFESGNSLAIDLRRAPAKAGDSAPAPRKISVRGGVHDDFSRIVFDWPGLVDYKATEQGSALHLAFSQNADLDLDSLRKDLPPFITGIEEAPEGKGVSVTISGVDAARFRHFRSETKVIVDVLPPAPGRIHAMLPADGPTPPAANPAAPATSQPGENDVKPDHPTAPAPRRPRSMVAGVTESPGAASAPISLLPDEMAVPTPAPAPQQASQAQSLTPELAPAAKTEAAASPAPPEMQLAQESLEGLKPLFPPETPAKAAKPRPAAPPAARKEAAQEAPASKESAAKESAAKESAPAKAAATAPAPAPAEKGTTISARAAAASAEAAPQAESDAAPAFGQPLLPPKLENAKPLAVAAKVEKGALVMSFPWTEPVAAAVYRRNGALWVVFDHPSRLDLSPLDSWRKEVAATPVTVAGATAIRLSVGPAMSASLRREGTGVSVVLSRAPARLATALSPAPAADGSARLMIPVADARNPLVITDPDVGDRLMVVPVMAANEGVAADRRFALFRILQTVTGVVVAPKADSVTVRTLTSGIEIANPNGLFLSNKDGAAPPEDTSQSAAAMPTGEAEPGLPPPGPQSPPPMAANPGKLFDFTAWGRFDQPFESTRNSLLQAVIKAPVSNRNNARLELARFYFARGLYPETQGVLGTMAAETPQIVSAPAFASLKGAAELLIDDYQDAATDLGAASLSTAPDAELWRGALAASQGHWAEAVPAFARVGDRIQDYPPALKVKFGLLAAETAIHSNEFPAAQTYLDFVAQAGPDAAAQARVKFLEGQLAAVRRDIDKAAGLFDEAIKNGDPATRAKAQFAKVTMLLDARKMPEQQAIDALENLRFAWRGDSFEFEVLRKLGDLYLATGQYEKGLVTLKRAVTFFPDNPHAKDAAEAMSAAFAKLYVDGEADKLPAIEALGIYQEFRELTPPNEQGDTVIRHLAERMVDVDLLDQAAALLEPLVTSRLQGADKIAVGTRLAVIRLWDQKPEDALRALTESAGPDIPADVAAERKRVEAKALALENKPKEALAALTGDTGRDADLLRSDILWRAQDWAEEAKVLARLTAPKGGDQEEVTSVSDDDAQLLVMRAAALWMAGQDDALDALRDQFGPAMAKTSFANDFKVVAAAPVGEIDSVAAVTARLAQVDAYAAFAADLKRGAPPAAKADPAKPLAETATPAKEVAAK